MPTPTAKSTADATSSPATTTTRPPLRECMLPPARGSPSLREHHSTWMHPPAMLGASRCVMSDRRPASAPTREPPPPRDDGDVALLRRTGQGEAEAFAALFERYGAVVQSICRALLPERGQAEAAAQEAFLRICRAPAGSDPTRRTAPP